MKRLAGTTLFGLLLSTLIGVFVGLSGYTFSFAQGASYLSSDPRACTNCHIMREQFDGWQKASHHAAATCNDCHVPHDLVGKYWTKMEHGYRHSKGFTFQDFHEPIRITESSLAVVQANCVRCHESFVREVTNHMGSGAVNCVQCHRSAGHGP